MQPRHVLGVALLGVTMLAARAVPAQLPVSPPNQNAPPRDRLPPPRVGTSALKGRVVDAATGAPIARARVRIQGGGGPRPSVLTDSSGRFAFPGLPAGPYTLMVDKSTYMTGRYPDPGRTLRSMMKLLTLVEGEALDNVTVSMYHGGSISGRVVDAHGDAVEFADVRVMRVVAGRTPTMRGQTSTNDLGEFRLPRLEAGSYLLLASARRTGPEEPVVDGKPPVQMLPTYFPGALSMDEAQPIPVARGESIGGVEVMLTEGYGATLVGTVVTADGQPLANGFVNARSIVKGVAGGISDGGASIRPDGTFRMQLSPGEYSIEVRTNPQFAPGQPPAPENERFGTARVSLSPTSVESVSIVVGRGATASGRVVFEGSTPPPPVPTQPIYVPFYNQDGPGCRSGRPQIAEDWTFRVEGLTGTCSGPQSTMFGRWTLKAVMYGGENLLERQVTFEPGQSLRDVQLVFTDKRTELSLHVSDERGEPTREYVAIVFSTDKARWTEGQRHLRTFVPVSQELLASRMAMSGSGIGASPPPAVLDQMRRELVPGLPPGEYYAIAVDDIESEASRDPRVLEQLVSSATRVTVSEDAPKEVALRRYRLTEVLPR